MTRTVPIGSVSRRTDFELLASARRASQGVVSVSFVPVEPLPGTAGPFIRVAYGVSRHTGGAVTRNRVRRRFRAVLGEFALVSGLYMVRPRTGIHDAPFSAIRTDLFAACSRLQAVQSEGELNVDDIDFAGASE
jgi:ribonuclease P protein component